MLVAALQAHRRLESRKAKGKLVIEPGESTRSERVVPLHLIVTDPENITMDHQNDNRSFGRFDLNEIATSFPPTAETLLIDTYLTNEDSASARVFRVYRGTPPHYHANCDEYLYVLSGKGTFWMDSPANGGEFAPGHFLFFKRGTVHALPEIIEGPVVFLSVDAPRRDPKDIIFVNPKDGSPVSFIQSQKK